MKDEKNLLLLQLKKSVQDEKNDENDESCLQIQIEQKDKEIANLKEKVEHLEKQLQAEKELRVEYEKRLKDELEIPETDIMFSHINSSKNLPSFDLINSQDIQAVRQQHELEIEKNKESKKRKRKFAKPSSMQKRIKEKVRKPKKDPNYVYQEEKQKREKQKKEKQKCASPELIDVDNLSTPEHIGKSKSKSKRKIQDCPLFKLLPEDEVNTITNFFKITGDIK